MTPAGFVEALQKLECDHAFNPYTDLCPVYDLEDAPEQRTKILLSVLEAALTRPVDSLWIGRDFGYRGGRRTGLAFTDDEHLPEHGRRWGLTIRSATSGEMVGERSARAVWKVLSRIDVPVFLWNVLPLHPHDPGNPFSNRSHNASERRSGQILLDQLVQLLKPLRIIAIGNDAEKAVMRLGSPVEVTKIRHPSYGGQNEFLSGMSGYYGVQ